MSTPPQDPPGHDPLPRSDDDRTRDIRLPSLPGRPQAAVRPEWQTHVPQSTADTPTAVGQPELGNAAASVPSPPRPEPAPPRPYVLPDELTDEMSSPPQGRQRTLAFDVPPAGAAPVAPSDPVVDSAPPAAPSPFVPAAYGPPSSAPPVHGRVRTRERNRRWPWVVLTVLPILVIIGAGLMLLFLLRGG